MTEEGKMSLLREGHQGTRPPGRERDKDSQDGERPINEMA